MNLKKLSASHEAAAAPVLPADDVTFISLVMPQPITSLSGLFLYAPLREETARRELRETT